MLSVTNKHYMLNIILLSVIMLNVVAPSLLLFMQNNDNCFDCFNRLNVNSFKY